MVENRIFEVKRQREGTFFIVCPCCGQKHYGNALEEYYHSGKIFSCSERVGLGCEAKLKIVKS